MRWNSYAASVAVSKMIEYENLQDDAVIGRVLRRSLVVLSILGTVGFVIAWWINRPGSLPPDETRTVVLPKVRQAPPLEVPQFLFTNITQTAGIDFVHENGATGEKLLPETMGGGCAFLDYDQDGDQDLLLVNSSYWPWSAPGADMPTTQLYANDGSGKFTDVSKDAGLDVVCYGMGVAVGDYDNNGFPDVFISAVGENRLFQNKAGRFTEVTTQANVAGDPSVWSTSCGWFDFDNDGHLDLIVGNYVQWSKGIDLAQDFRLTGIGRAYGPPFSFEGTFPYLYRNGGDGTFSDVSESSGVQQKNLVTSTPLAKTLGVTPVDANRDGWMDFILANDTVRNLLFINQKDGTFQEVGIEAGIAFDATGKARGAMGIDTGCFRNDDCLGVAVANFANEMTALYVSAGKELAFTDEAIPSGLGPPTRGDLTFGLFFFDANLDGRLDLFSANGHIEDNINLVQKSQRYRQPPRLFFNAGADSADEFLTVKPIDASAFATPLVGRGAAYADIDSDGDLDIVVTQVGDAPALLRNDTPNESHFLRFRLIGTSVNRDAIGARIVIEQAGRTLERQVMPTRSYLSQVELPVTIGLGKEPRVEMATVIWPDGASQVVTDYSLDGTTTVTQSATVRNE